VSGAVASALSAWLNFFANGTTRASWRLTILRSPASLACADDAPARPTMRQTTTDSFQLAFIM
jgi:hypothetical protein